MPISQYKAGVFALTFICGLIDAACFLALGGVFAELMTGNLLLFAFSIGTLDVASTRLIIYGSAIIAFCLGALMAGLAANGKLSFSNKSVDHSARARMVGYPFEFALVLGATVIAVFAQPAAQSPALLDSGASVDVNWVAVTIVAMLAFAMGIHNALMRKHGVPDIATNVMTLTFAGLISESALAGGQSPRWQRRLSSILLFMAGAALGSYLLTINIAAPLVLATIIFAVALYPLTRGVIEGEALSGYQTTNSKR